MLIVDSREPDFVKKLFPLAVIQKLETGDFRYNSPEGRIVLIERKTPDDLTASLIDGRFHRQLLSMLEEVGEKGRAAVLIDGTPSDPRYFHMVSAALLSAQDCGVSVFQRLGKLEDFVLFVIRKLVESDSKPVEARRKVSMEKSQISLLRTVPGIGLQTAQRLLSEHGSLKLALESLYSEREEFFNAR